MSIFSSIRSIFGGSAGKGPEFGALVPDEIEAYWLAGCRVDAAQREGEAALRSVFDEYGVIDAEHWERVETAKGQGDVAVATALAGFGLDPERFQAIDVAWNSRMGGQADAMAATVLSGLYGQYLMLERNAVARAN